MCGIFGIFLSNNRDRQLTNIILNGLAQLQNRGYDSAGLCVLNDDGFQVHKCASTQTCCALDKLWSAKLESDPSMVCGMGHNRWATHGVKSDVNAHPHLSNDARFSIVHNGIIENFMELKTLLLNEGFTFSSQTDTEVIVNLVQYQYAKTKNVEQSIQTTLRMLRGTYGLIVQTVYEPNVMYCVRNGSPLLVGRRDDFVMVTSEQSGFCGQVSHYITLHNDDLCIVHRDPTDGTLSVKSQYAYTKKNALLLDVELTPHPFEHWTLKEIHEQPNVILHALNKGGRIQSPSEVKLGGLDGCREQLVHVDHLILLGCGTSFFAGQYGVHFFKRLCQFHTVQTFDGADFDLHDLPKKGTVAFIFISQSGETKDLHRCIEIARNHNIHTIGVVNVVDSLIAREVDCGVYCNAGKEVGVASTKAFTSQVVCLAMVALWFSELHGVLPKRRERVIADLHNLANDFQMTLDQCREKMGLIEIPGDHLFVLGKGTDECIANEGALKIKEITYIHAEGYSSSSLKHGPFALLDANFPVVLLNLEQTHKYKTLNCFQEVVSRHAPVLLITNDVNVVNHVEGANVLLIPENESFASLLGIVPIQMLAYFLSVKRGNNPDKPKNLAKVVTVE